MTLLSAVAPVAETPVDWWLAEQADLTAVERFAQRHDGALVPAQARYYRDLIPRTRPAPGQQYGFEVDLDACTGCKACVTACHSLNGLDDGESWRSITLVTGSGATGAFQQTVTGACHHCVDPACLNGCPVDAYEKDPLTGIVAHLDDQCIGCSYCTLTCPYEVPVYNHRRGIVRKCDMCTGRLAAGEAPACAQACPTGAIAIRLVDTASLVATAGDATLVPGSAPSAITVPSTRYLSTSRRVDDTIVLGSRTGPARSHPPLTVMLVLTQLSVGAFIIDLVLRALTARGAGVLPVVDAMIVAVAGVLALGVSVGHLGRPRYGYRAIIGLRHSWLSREIVAFGGFMSLAVAYAIALLFDPPQHLQGLVDALGGTAAATGVMGVMCSVLIYSTTRRSSWRPLSVATKFGLTALVCGLAAVTWAGVVSAAMLGNSRPNGLDSLDGRLCLVLAALVAVKLAGEASVFRHLTRARNPEGVRRASLLIRDLRTTTVTRFWLGFGAGVALPLLIATGGTDGAPTWVGVIAATLVLGGVTAGELAERSLFFTAASPPR